MILSSLSRGTTTHTIGEFSVLTTCIIAAVMCKGSDFLVAAEKSLPIEGEVFAVEGHEAFTILPKATKELKPTPWVWYAPTLPRLPGSEETWMFRKFLDQGIAIAGIDVGESYGSPAGRSLYTALYDHLVEERGFSKRACLLARSRGGLMLYNWAAEHPKSIACIAGIYPVCNLTSYPGLSRAHTAYELSKQALAHELSQHNPIDRLRPLASAGVPILHIHGDQDKIVPLSENSSLVANRYKELGGAMTLKIIQGQGHNMWSGWFQDQQLVDFIVKNAQRPPNGRTNE